MRDLGIDLGTANVLVYMKGRGIILNEPSVIAINHLNKEIVAVGKAAHNMVGRTPGNITAIRPMKDGVIADYDTTATMLKYFIHGSRLKSTFSIKKPRVIVCAPSGITGVEKRAIYEATMQAGAKQAYIIEEPFAAAIGAGLPVAEPLGSMVVDIGGGTTDVAIISLGGIVTSKSIRVGGDIMDNSIIQYVKRRYNMLIGERTAEAIKIELGCAIAPETDSYYEVRGRDLFTGLPKPIKLYSSEIQEALSEPVNQIVDAVKYTLEKCPPELSGDIMERGIVLTGGGALLRDLDRLIRKETHIPVFVANEALDCVAIGTGKALENISLLERLDKEKPLK